MTSPSDIKLAVELGVDAVGVIFAEQSPRRVTVEQAIELRSFVPENVAMVGVFVDSSAEEIESAVGLVGIDVIQLHGDESEEFASQLSKPYIKALRVKSENFLKQQLAYFSSANAILLDPYVKGVHGGTGQRLNTKVWPEQGRELQAEQDALGGKCSFLAQMHKNDQQKIILAGGLNAHNVASAINETQPYAIDLSSGVESSPGIKCESKMRNLFDSIA